MDHVCDAFKIVPTDGILIGTCWVCGMDFVVDTKEIKKRKYDSLTHELVCSL